MRPDDESARAASTGERTERKLVVVPVAGLCNRIQTLVCAQLLAEDTSRALYLNWHASERCGATFADLFDSPIPPLDELPAGTKCYSSIQRHAWSAGERYQRFLANAPEQRFTRLPGEPAEVVAIFSCHQFLDYYHDPRFAPRVRELFARIRPDLVQEADAFQAAHFGTRTVGVHIRRTDWRSQRTVEHYVASMRRFTNARFFVCSDDPEVVAALRAQVPTIVEYPKASLARGDREAIRQALVDVVLLSRTAYLIGTQGSSFSMIAQTAGDIPSDSDYGVSISLRDFKLGNLRNVGKLVRRLVRPGRTV